MNVGELIAKHRLKKGITQEELADKVGCTAQHISSLELGRKTPKLQTLVKLAEAFNQDLCITFKKKKS